jgi:hypothetical protein
MKKTRLLHWNAQDIRKGTYRWSWPARLKRKIKMKIHIRKLSGKTLFSKLSANECCDN